MPAVVNSYQFYIFMNNTNYSQKNRPMGSTTGFGSMMIIIKSKKMGRMIRLRILHLWRVSWWVSSNRSRKLLMS